MNLGIVDCCVLYLVKYGHGLDVRIRYLMVFSVGGIGDGVGAILGIIGITNAKNTCPPVVRKRRAFFFPMLGAKLYFYS